jgi:hypothetical protein
MTWCCIEICASIAAVTLKDSSKASYPKRHGVELPSHPLKDGPALLSRLSVSVSWCVLTPSGVSVLLPLPQVKKITPFKGKLNLDLTDAEELTPDKVSHVIVENSSSWIYWMVFMPSVRPVKVGPVVCLSGGGLTR